jgi:hypothetical protein
MGWLALFLIGGGFTVFLTMGGDLQAQLIGLVITGIGFVFYKMDTKKPKR